MEIAGELAGVAGPWARTRRRLGGGRRRRGRHSRPVGPGPGAFAQRGGRPTRSRRRRRRDSQLAANLGEHGRRIARLAGHPSRPPGVAGANPRRRFAAGRHRGPARSRLRALRTGRVPAAPVIHSALSADRARCRESGLGQGVPAASRSRATVARTTGVRARSPVTPAVGPRAALAGGAWSNGGRRRANPRSVLPLELHGPRISRFPRGPIQASHFAQRAARARFGPACHYWSDSGPGRGAARASLRSRCAAAVDVPGRALADGVQPQGPCAVLYVGEDGRAVESVPTHG